MKIEIKDIIHNFLFLLQKKLRQIKRGSILYKKEPSTKSSLKNPEILSGLYFGNPRLFLSKKNCSNPSAATIQIVKLLN